MISSSFKKSSLYMNLIVGDLDKGKIQLLALYSLDIMEQSLADGAEGSG